jgi:uncharacterized protein YcnI
MSRLRISLVTGTALLLVGLTATAASAHVTVSSPDAQQGGEAKVTFQMPAESDKASAVKLQVALPTDTPFASVDVEPQPGWTYKTTTTTLPRPITTDDGDQVTEAITGITWTATSGGLKPGEFGEFSISVGPLPKANTVQFKAIQTYSDGSVVRWIEQPGANGQEPEHPAPTLTLTAASATTGATTTPGSAKTSTTSSDSGTKTLAIIALIVGILGLLAGAGALALSRRATTARR